MSTGRFDYELRANASGFTSEVQKAERSVQQLDKAQKGAADSSKEWSKAGIAAGAAIAAIATTGALALRKVIQETSDSEKAMAQLNATLKSTGGVSGRTAEDLAKTAKSLQNLTTFSDDAIITAQSLLATFKNINKSGDVFDRATKSVLDLSAKMGGDLKGAVLQIGKALENPTKGMTALAKSGVSFTDAQKDVITALVESGRLLEAQNMLLEEVESQFEGSARAAREALGGALEALAITWGDLFEAQESASKSMTDAINGLNDTLADPELKSNLDYLIGKFAQWTSSAVNGMSGFVTVVREANSPLTKLKEDIDEVSAALTRAENKGFWREAKKQQAILDGLRKEYDRVSNSIKNGDKIIASLMPKLPEVTKAVKEQTAAIYDGEKAVKAINDAQKVWDARLKYAQVRIKNTSDELDELSDAAKESAKAQEEAAKDTARYWDDVRTTLSGMFFEMAADGQNAFDVLVNGFKGMIAKMLAEAAANRILLMVGVGASGSAAAGTAASSVGGGSILSGLSSLGGGITAGGQALYEGIGNILSNNGLTGLGDMAYTKGLNTTGLSIGLDVGGGLVGGYLGNKAFGQTSGIGAAAGGIAGSILIPIPGVGAAVGSFLGSGVESLFGGKNNGKNAGYTNFNLGTGANNAAGIGKSFDQANVDSASGLAGALQQFAAAIGGSSLAGTINVGKGKINYAGKSYSSADDFLADAYKDVIRGADNLDDALKPLITSLNGTADEMARFAQAIVSIDAMSKTNTVSNAVTEFGKAQLSAMDAYKQHTDALQEQIRAFDGSLSAATALNTALYENKTAAYEFALALQSIGKSIAEMADNQAQTIRESVLTPQQLLDKRLDDRDRIAAQLLVEDDPEVAASLGRELLDLNKLIFDSITEDQQKQYYEDFARVADDTNNRVQYVIDNALENLTTTQDGINQAITEMLQATAVTNQHAADTQLQAANIILEAANKFSGRSSQVAV